MRVLVAITLAMILFAGMSLAQGQEDLQFPRPTQQHQWLGQLAGDWTAEVTINMPDQPTIETTGTSKVRTIGGFWTVCEHQGEFMGQPFVGLQSLGYDTSEGKFVGTWLDSMSGYLWNYEGELNDDETVLTLSTEGPCPAAPGKLSQFKEVIELKGQDHYVFTSSVQGEDGEWTTNMTIDYHRKK